MANPLLDTQAAVAPGQYGSALQDGEGSGVRDLLDFGDKAEWGVAGLVLAAAALVTLLKVAGFRAMIAVGRN